MLTADQIKLHPASILPSEKNNKIKKNTTQKRIHEYYTKLVPMLDAASNVCKKPPFCLPFLYRHDSRDTYAQGRMKTKKRKNNRNKKILPEYKMLNRCGTQPTAVEANKM